MSSATGAKAKKVADESGPPVAAASASPATNGGSSSAAEANSAAATAPTAAAPSVAASGDASPPAGISAAAAPTDCASPPSEKKSPAKAAAKSAPIGTPEQIEELEELTKKLADYLTTMESGQGVRDTLNDDIVSFLEKTLSQENLKKDRAILLELDSWLKHQAKILDQGSQDGDEALWSNQEPRIRMLMHKLCAFYGLVHNIMGPYQNSTIRIERQKDHFRNWNFSVSDLARYYELRDQVYGSGGHNGPNKEASPSVLNGEKKILRREGPPSTPKGGSPYSGQQQATPPRTFEERRQDYDKRRKEIVGSAYHEQPQHSKLNNSGYRRGDQSATSNTTEETSVAVAGVSASPSPQPQYIQVYLRDDLTVYRLVQARVSDLTRGECVFIDLRGPLLTPDATSVYRYDPDQRHALAPAPVRVNPAAATATAAAANAAVANQQQQAQQPMEFVHLANNYPASIPAHAATAGLYFAHPFAYHHPSVMAAANLPAVYPASGAGAGFFFPTAAGGSPPQAAANVATSQSAAAAQHITSPPPQQQQQPQQQPQAAAAYHQLQQQQQAAAAMYTAYHAQFVPASAAGYAAAPQHPYHQMAAAAAAAARFVGPSLHLYSQPQAAISVSQARLPQGGGGGGGGGGSGGIESQQRSS